MKIFFIIFLHFGSFVDNKTKNMSHTNSSDRNESNESFLLFSFSLEFYSRILLVYRCEVRKHFLIFIDTMPNIAFLFLVAFLNVFITTQTTIARELNNDADTFSPAKYNQQLYELYKIMRIDPNLAMISNNDLLLYIYRNFGVNRQPHLMELIKTKGSNRDTMKIDSV